MIFELWHVYVIQCNLQKGTQRKFCLCFSNNPSPLFFFISTERRWHGVGQIELDSGDHDLLQYTSYIDLSDPKELSPAELKTAEDHGPFAAGVLKAKVEAPLRLGNKTLPERFQKLAVNNLN